MKCNVWNINHRTMKTTTGLSLLFLQLCCALVVDGSRDGTNGEQLSIRHQRAKSRRLHRSSDDCSAVSLSLANSSITIPVKKFHDADLKICNQSHFSRHHVTSSSTCCTRDTELRLRSLAADEFHQVIRQQGALLRDLLSRSTDEYREDFMTMLESTRNRSIIMLQATYRIPESEVKELVDELFVDLMSYLRHQRINIDESSDRFFNHLFPTIFLLTSNNMTVGSHLTVEYRTCVANVRHSVEPFGFGPRRLSGDLTKSFGTARSLLDAFQLAADVMNATDHASMTESCSLAFTRLIWCPACSGYTDVRPCSDFCYNVMRGCLVALTELNEHWNKFVDAVEHTSSSITGSNDLQNVLLQFDTRVHEAIMHAVNTASRYHDTVVSKCGELPKVKVSGDAPRPLRTPFHHDPPGLWRQGPEVKLSAKIAMFVRNLASSKNFYNKLPDALCNSERLSAGNYDTCWNGTHLGPYTRKVEAQNVWAQIDFNLEVNIEPVEQSSLNGLADRLDHLAGLLRSRVLPPHVMLADENVAGSGDWEDGRGSGGRGHLGPYPGGTDDEDDEQWSGSGSGDGQPEVIVPDNKEINTGTGGLQPPDHGGRPGSSTEGDWMFGERSTSRTPSPYRSTQHVPHKTPGTISAASRTPSASRSFLVLMISSLVLPLCLVFFSNLYRRMLTSSSLQ